MRETPTRVGHARCCERLPEYYLSKNKCCAVALRMRSRRTDGGGQCRSEQALSNHMTTIDADELLERADVCAFRDTALELLRADASPWQLRMALNMAVSDLAMERLMRRSEADTMAQLSDENTTRERDALCQRLNAIADEIELQYGPDCGAVVLLDACLEIAASQSRAFAHMMVDATYNRLEGKPRARSPQTH